MGSDTSSTERSLEVIQKASLQAISAAIFLRENNAERCMEVLRQMHDKEHHAIMQRITQEETDRQSFIHQLLSWPS
jgi:hypothetical protein